MKNPIFLAGIILCLFSCAKPDLMAPSGQINTPTVARAAASTDVPVTVTVDLSKQGIQIPKYFTGLSFETASLLKATWYNSQNTSFINLVKGLGHGILRVGGGSVDQVQWTNSATTSTPLTMTSTDMYNFFSFAGATTWPVLFGVNLHPATVPAEAAEIRYLSAHFSSMVACLELGNEPDLYNPNGQRPSTYGYTDFLNEWTTLHDSILLGAPTQCFSGPSTASGTWITPFGRDKHSSVCWLNEHYYKLGTGGDTVQTIAKLLTKDTAFLTRAYVLRGAATPYNLTWRIDECNSSAANSSGVSNSFASAIWGLDFMFTVAQQGGAGVNFHSGNTYFTPISFLSGPATPNPLYYGMLFFSKASLGKMLTVGSTTSGTINFTSYAVQQADGTVQVTLINKDLANEAAVSLSAANGTTQLTNASVLRLQGPSPSSLTGTLFGGSAVKADGTWASSANESLVMSGNTTTVKVPACSAVLITLH
jgi:hypothetical protein